MSYKLDEQDETSLYISVIILGEIEKGILNLRKADPRRSQKLTAWLGKHLHKGYY